MASSSSFSETFLTTLKIALPSASAQSVQVILMVFLSHCASFQGSAKLAASGLAEIIVVVTSIQLLIGFGIGLNSVVSFQIGEKSGNNNNWTVDGRKKIVLNYIAPETNNNNNNINSNDDDDENRNNIEEKMFYDETVKHSHQTRVRKNDSSSPSNYDWKIHNFRAVKTFWQSAILTLMLSFVVCLPLSVFGGPFALHIMNVDAQVINLVQRQLHVLVLYPIFFGIYICLAQLCIIEKRTGILVVSSFPVVLVTIPLLAWYFGLFSQSSNNNDLDSSSLSIKMKMMENRDNDNNLKFQALAWGWLLAMFVEMMLMIVLCFYYKLIPSFTMVLGGSDHHYLNEDTENSSNNSNRHAAKKISPTKIFHVIRSISANLMFSSKLGRKETYKILFHWLLPTLGVFVSGYAAFEIAFVVGSGSGSGSEGPPSGENNLVTSSSCSAATLVIAHQLRFLLCLLPNAFLTALNSLLSRELGAKNFTAATKVVQSCVIGGCIFSLLAGLFLVYAKTWVLQFFHSNLDPCIKGQFSSIVFQMGVGFAAENVVWQAVTTLRILGHRGLSLGLTCFNWWILMLPYVKYCVASNTANRLLTSHHHGNVNNYIDINNNAKCVFDGLMYSQLVMIIPATCFGILKWREWAQTFFKNNVAHGSEKDDECCDGNSNADVNNFPPTSSASDLRKSLKTNIITVTEERKFSDPNSRNAKIFKRRNQMMGLESV